VRSVDLPGVDITSRSQVEKLLSDGEAELVINCAAFTNVDACVEHYESAYMANAIGPMNLALECKRRGMAMLQVSTNEVFDGTRRSGYEEWMQVGPANRYGMSKAAGEFNVRSVLPEHFIVRTAWLFSPSGSNFIHAILGKARTDGSLRVVDDEIGNPTYVADLAEAIGRLIRTGQYGTYHMVGSGACSRWEFANEILRAAGLEGVRNEPIPSSEFKRLSTPPRFAELHNLNGAAIGIELRPWQEALREFVAEIPELNEVGPARH